MGRLIADTSSSLKKGGDFDEYHQPTTHLTQQQQQQHQLLFCYPRNKIKKTKNKKRDERNSPSASPPSSWSAGEGCGQVESGRQHVLTDGAER